MGGLKINTTGGVYVTKKTKGIKINTTANKPKNDGTVVGYAAANVGIGLAGLFEGLGDFVAGSYYQLIGDDDYAKYLHMNDVTGGWKQRLDKDFNPSSTVKFIGDVSGAIGQALPSVALGVATAGGSVALQAAGGIALGASYAGRGVTSAVQQTGELGAKENIYGVLTGGSEAATDLLLGGTVKAGKALITTARQAAKVGAKKVARNTLLKGMLSSATSEAAEEFIQEFADTFLLRLTGVNKEAEYSLENAMYSALIGGISGGILGGVTNGINNGVNVRIGQDVQSRGLSEQLLKTADYVRDVHLGNSKNYSNITSQSLKALTASVDAYRGLNAEQKQGTRGAMMLGEIKQELLAFESAAGVDAIKTRMQESDLQTRQSLAKSASELFGKAITAEDIATNKGDITHRIALESFVTGALGDNSMEMKRAEIEEAIAAERLPYINQSEGWNGESARYRDPKSGKYIIIEPSKDGTWSMAYSPTAVFDAENLMVKKSLSAEDVKKTLAGLREGNLDIGENGIRAKGEVDPDVVKSFANTKKGRKAKKDYKRQVKEEKKNAVISKNQEKMQGDSIPQKSEKSTQNAKKVDRKFLADKNSSAVESEDMAQEARESSQTDERAESGQEGASEAQNAAERENAGENAPKMSERERARGYSDSEADEARRIVRNFDEMSREKRIAIIEMMRSANKCGASKSFMKHAAAMIGYWRKGLWIIADGDTSEKGFYQSFSDGTRLIVVNPNQKADNGKSAVNTAFVHELGHDIWTKASQKTKDALYRLATEGASAAEVEDIGNEYKAGYKKRGLKLDEEVLREEVFTNLIAKTLGNERFLERFDITPGRMTAFKRSIKAVTRMAKCFFGKDKYLYSKCEKMARAFIRAMGEQMVFEAVSGSNKRYLFAGKKAKTADKFKLENAQRMLSEGIDSETVRKETGWFKGYDGKWRFEIDDSAMKVTIPESRYVTVGDIVEHQQLFEAYPNLKDIWITFHDIKGARGSYSRMFGDIELSSKLLENSQDLKEVISHELQHAIQDIEGFAKGTSVEYWERKLVEGYDSRQDYIKAEEKALLDQIKAMRGEDKEFVWDMEELLKQRPNHPRGAINWDTLEKIEEDSPQWKHFDKERESLAKIYGDSKVSNFLTISGRLEQMKHKAERDALQLYYETAGEIEARDVQKRLHLDVTERKNIRPDIDQEDVVFADNSAVAKDFVGWTVDHNEVYKTTPKTMSMSDADRKIKFFNDFINDFRGRTAKFERNGHIHYAQFDNSKNALGKLVYEGKDPSSKSSDSGYKAKIRMLSDGNLFELVEDTPYYDTEHERGKNKKSHKNAKHWDYYVKTIIVDGKAYDVMVNVRNDVIKNDYSTKEEYVYSIRFRDNKMVATSLVHHATSKATSEFDIATTNSISQNSEKSTPAAKKMFSLDENKSTRGDDFDADEFLRKAMENGGMIEKQSEEAEAVKAESEKSQTTVKNKRKAKTKKQLQAEVKELKSDNRGLRRANENLAKSQSKAQKQSEELFEKNTELNRKNAGLRLKAANYEKLAASANERADVRKAEEVKRIATSVKKLVNDFSFLVNEATHRKYTAGGNVGATILADPAIGAFAAYFAKKGSAYNIMNKSTRDGVKLLLEFYNPDNPIFADENTAASFFGENSNNIFSSYRPEIAEMIKAIAEGEGDLSIFEMQQLGDVVRNIRHIYENYDAVRRKGKSESAKVLSAQSYAEQVTARSVLESDTDERPRLKKIFKFLKESYLYTVVTPEEILRDLENHVKNPILSQLFREIRLGEAEAGRIRAEILTPISEFLAKKENREFFDDLSKPTMDFCGIKISVAQAVGIYETSKRKHAQQRLYDPDGGIKIYDAERGERVDIRGLTKTSIDNLYNQFDATAKEYIRHLEAAMAACKKYKVMTDRDVMGFTNAVSGHYYPITTDENYFAKDITDIRQSMGIEDVVQNKSFNQNTVQGAQAPLVIEDSQRVLERHVFGIAQYAGLYIPLQNFGKVYGAKFDPSIPASEQNRVNELDKLREAARVTKKTSLREYYNTKVWAKKDGKGGLDSYLTKLFADIQRIKPGETSIIDRAVEFIRSGYVNSVFGLNAKIIFTQLASYPAAFKVIDADCLAQAFGNAPFGNENAEAMDKYSKLTLARSFEGANAADGLIEKLSELGKKTSIGIEFTDRGVILALYSACQLQVAKDGGAAVGSEANLKAAGELLDNVLLDTQTTSLLSERSALARDKNEFAKTFSMFKNEAVKAASSLYGAISTYLDHKRLAESDESYGELLEEDQKRLTRNIGGYLGSSAVVALVSIIFSRIRSAGKDEEEKEKLGAMVTKEGIEAVFNLLPIISDGAAFMIDGCDIDSLPYEVFNDMLSAIRGVSTAFDPSETREAKAKYLRSTAYTAGKVLGLPVQNTYRLANTTVAIFNKPLAYKMNDLFDTSKSYKSDLDNALEGGNDRLAETIMSLWVSNKITGKAGTVAVDELTRLYSLSDKDDKKLFSMPRSIPSSLSRQEKAKFTEAYSGADGAIADLISSKEYKALDDASKAQAVKACYDVYYVRGQEICGLEVTESGARISGAAEGLDENLLYSVIGFAKTQSGDNKKAHIIQYLISLGIGIKEREKYLAALGYKV